MHMLKNAPLSTHSTMRLGGTAKYLCEVTTREELLGAIRWAQAKHLKAVVIGSGSNIIWGDEGYPGLVIVMAIKSFKTVVKDSQTVYVTVGGGEEWDDVVRRCVDMGLSGIEFLSLIPGTAGATPVQNVGAYGREIAEVMVALEAFDTAHDKFVTLRPEECDFGYRTSRFKTAGRGRFVITSVTMALTKTNPSPPFYASLQQYFDEHKISEFTPKVVREAVIAVRTKKLPDPDVIANNGSFFANPIVAPELFDEIKSKFPDVISWPAEDGHVKLSAAWLIEQAGFKDYHDPETGMATWNRQALVLINEKAKTTADLLKFKRKIVDAVQAKFGVLLTQEPELI